MIFRGRRRAGRKKCRFRGGGDEFGLTLCGNLRGLREDPSKRNEFVAGAGNGAKSAGGGGWGATPPHAARIKSLFRCYMGTFVVFGRSPIEVKRNDCVAGAKRFRGRRRAWREKSRRVAVTLPEFSFCFSYSQSGPFSTPPWHGSLSTARKRRKYQCFQLLQSAKTWKDLSEGFFRLLEASKWLLGAIFNLQLYAADIKDAFLSVRQRELVEMIVPQWVQELGEKDATNNHY